MPTTLTMATAATCRNLSGPPLLPFCISQRTDTIISQPWYYGANSAQTHATHTLEVSSNTTEPPKTNESLSTLLTKPGTLRDLSAIDAITTHTEAPCHF